VIDLNEISLNVQSGRAIKTSELIHQALEENYSVEHILKDGLRAGIAAAEDQYGKEMTNAPDLLAALRAMNMGLRVLRTTAEFPVDEFGGTVIAGTAVDDLYDTEKNLTVVMMQTEGLQVIDLGASVPTGQFIEAARTEDAQLIFCSAAMIATMPYLKELVQTAEASGIRNRIKIMIAGKPVTERYRALIGADFYAPDMETAAGIAAAHCRRTLLPAA
jgi:methanogenic corrinoid protein MtbC1